MQKFINMFQNPLATNLTSVDTSVQLTDTTGLVLGAGEYYLAVLQSQTDLELIKITAVVSNTLTIVRAQEGSTAASFVIGDLLEVRLTAGGLDGLLQRSEVLNDPSFADDSPTLPPSQQSVAAYVANLNPMLYVGGIDCSTNPNYPAADAGSFYVVTISGLIGGASGKAVQAGDKLLCKTDASPAGDELAVGTNWDLGQMNMDKATTAEAEAGTDDIKYITALKTKQAIKANPKDWARIILSVAQTTNMALNDYIKLDTISEAMVTSQISIDAIAFEITLPKGKAFYLSSSILFTTDGQILLQFKQLDGVGIGFHGNNAFSNAGTGQSSNQAVIDLTNESTNCKIALVIIDSNSPLAVQVNETSIFIQEVD